MANISFRRLGLLEEPETRKPSKLRLAILLLLLLLLILTAVFIGLYIKEKIGSSSSKKAKDARWPSQPTESSYSPSEPTVPSYSPSEKNKDTDRPCQPVKPSYLPCEKTKHVNLTSDTCISPGCITSSAGMFPILRSCAFAGCKLSRDISHSLLTRWNKLKFTNVIYCDQWSSGKKNFQKQQHVPLHPLQSNKETRILKRDLRF